MWKLENKLENSFILTISFCQKILFSIITVLNISVVLYENNNYSGKDNLPSVTNVTNIINDI